MHYVKVGIFAQNKKVEKKLPVKPIETKNKISQAKLLAGTMKHKTSESGNSVKRLKPDLTQMTRFKRTHPACLLAALL